MLRVIPLISDIGCHCWLVQQCLKLCLSCGRRYQAATPLLIYAAQHRGDMDAVTTSAAAPRGTAK